MEPSHIYRQTPGTPHLPLSFFMAWAQANQVPHLNLTQHLPLHITSSKKGIWGSNLSPHQGDTHNGKEEISSQTNRENPRTVAAKDKPAGNNIRRRKTRSTQCFIVATPYTLETLLLHITLQALGWVSSVTPSTYPHNMPPLNITSSRKKVWGSNSRETLI